MGMPDEDEQQAAKSAPWTLIVEAALTIAAVYLIWGHGWSPAFWAIWSILAVVIIVNEVWRHAGRYSSAAYWRYRRALEAILIVVILVVGLLRGSWWLTAIALGLGVLLLRDVARERRRCQPRP